MGHHRGPWLIMAYVNPVSDLRHLKFTSATVSFQRLQSIAKEISAKYDKPIDNNDKPMLMLENW